jgi:hypothetical protein
MKRRPLHYVTKEKEQELIQKLLFLVDNSEFDPENTIIIMASPDYSATVAMHLAHAWSRDGEIIPIVPVEVPYPDENEEYYIQKMRHDLEWYKEQYGKFNFEKVVIVEAGVIRGSNWVWLVEEFENMGFSREDESLVLVALLENTGSMVKSDYVAEYFDDDTHELVFYFERFNNHWPVK